MPDSTFHLPTQLAADVSEVRAEWERAEKLDRLWRGDASLWTGANEDSWLGWLEATDPPAIEVSSWLEFGREARDARFRDALLIGMGGSSLCPDVLARSFGPLGGHPRLHVLDSTVPEQIRSTEEKLDPHHTLCIVASKSGSTLEPRALMQYFWRRLEDAKGRSPGGNFVAITDPGSQLESEAIEGSFRRVFHGVPSIGGRFSALSAFGMVPAAVAGIDVSRLLDRARSMAELCRSPVGETGNPGVELGLILGVAALCGRDKLTLLTSPGLRSLGGWLEQLIAESTGKQGKAIIPVDLEPLQPIDRYGDDRIFVELHLAGEPGALTVEDTQALRAAGHPIVAIELDDQYALGAEFFRWEIATAVAGSILQVNPFDQPDVEASKVVTRSLMEAFETTGELPSESPLIDLETMAVYGTPDYATSLGFTPGDADIGSLLRSHIARAESGDYFALLAFLEMDESTAELLEQIRTRVLAATRVATCVGFGPRFLHSTGQAYKGGPNSGVFLQITASHSSDLPVPGNRYSFGTIAAAQARGDLAVLVERDRRALRLHLKGDPAGGLQQLHQFLS